MPVLFFHDKISQVQKRIQGAKSTTNLRFIDLKFIDIRFIDLKFIDTRFIELKKNLKWKKVTYLLICLKSLYNGNISSIKPIKVLN